MAGEARALLLAPPKHRAAPQIPPFCWWDLSENPAPGPAGSTSLCSAGGQVMPNSDLWLIPAPLGHFFGFLKQLQKCSPDRTGLPSLALV